MSTWKEILDAFDIGELRTEAAGTIKQALSSHSNGNAVKILIALIPLCETEAQRQGVAEAIASRLDGALAWNIVHMNRCEEQVRQVLEQAILIRMYSASPDEEMPLLRRGLDEDLKLYGALLIDVARRRPTNELRELAGYVVWQEARYSKTDRDLEGPWQHLRRELENILGENLPRYQESARALENRRIRETLEALSSGSEIVEAYRLAQQTGGSHLGIISEYLANWASDQTDWEPLMEASNYPADDPVGQLSRTTLTLLYTRATPSLAASRLHSALEQAIHEDMRMSLGFFLVLIEHLARTKPSLEIWKIAPLLKAQIALETRYPIKTRLGIQNSTVLTNRGHSFYKALACLESLLPDPALPQPAENLLDSTQLPRPAEAGSIDVVSLPAPATGIIQSESDSRWKQWTMKFKR